MNINALRDLVPLVGVALVATFLTYLINLWVFSTHPYLAPIDTLFLEGVFFILTGILIFIGSGGISRTSQRAALLASAAKAVNDDVIGPSEIFRRDAWRPRGYTRAGLVLIMTGVFLLVIYFISV